MFGPIGQRPDGTFVFASPVGNGHVPMIALEDLGFFARYSFDHRAEVSAQDLEIATDWVSWDRLVATFTKVTGHKAEYLRQSLDSEGWFDTGDLGRLLLDGSLVLTGRAKDTIVLSSGENIEPGPLEEALVESPLIEQVMLVGQDRKQLGALLVPKAEPLAQWARGLGLPEPALSPEGAVAATSASATTRASPRTSTTTPVTARYHLGKAFRAAGVDFRGFHPGRKYAGTRLLRQIKDFGRVAAHLGHESVDTTRRGYAQLAADDLKDDLSGW